MISLGSEHPSEVGSDKTDMSNGFQKPEHRETMIFTLKDFIEQQQHGFSDSTPRAGSDRLQKSAKSLLSALQLMSINQISTQKYGSGNSTRLNHKKNSSNRMTSKESF